MAHRASTPVVETPSVRSRQIVRLGDRGRLVLPARLRREMGVEAGARLLLILEDSGALRIVDADAAAERAMGLLRADRSLADELMVERRRAARDE